MGKLRVRVQPGARRDELLGFRDGVLRVKLTAPPIEGRANKALVVLLAALLDRPKTSISVVAGLTSRDKTVEIVGLTAEEIAGRLAALCPPSSD